MVKTKIIENFGLYFDEIGLSKTYGRLFGYFMTQGKPVSMGQIVEHLKISKSTASVELRRLITMGFIEKVLVANERADFYQLKRNIWGVNLNQKLHDIKRLRSIIAEVPSNDLEELKHIKEMDDYCVFLESEMEILRKKYSIFQQKAEKENE